VDDIIPATTAPSTPVARDNTPDKLEKPVGVSPEKMQELNDLMKNSKKKDKSCITNELLSRQLSMDMSKHSNEALSIIEESVTAEIKGANILAFSSLSPKTIM
jgi:hypothetical protein